MACCWLNMHTSHCIVSMLLYGIANQMHHVHKIYDMTACTYYAHIILNMIWDNCTHGALRHQDIFIYISPLLFLLTFSSAQNGHPDLHVLLISLTVKAWWLCPCILVMQNLLSLPSSFFLSPFLFPFSPPSSPPPPSLLLPLPLLPSSLLPLPCHLIQVLTDMHSFLFQTPVTLKENIEVWCPLFEA